MATFNELNAASTTHRIAAEVRCGNVHTARLMAEVTNLTTYQKRMVNRECSRWGCPPIFPEVA